MPITLQYSYNECQDEVTILSLCSKVFSRGFFVCCFVLKGTILFLLDWYVFLSIYIIDIVNATEKQLHDPTHQQKELQLIDKSSKSTDSPLPH